MAAVLTALILLVGSTFAQPENHTDAPAPQCTSCMLREGLRNLSLAAIKEQILSKLGMKHAPNMTGRPFPKIPKIPKIHQLLDVYRLGSSPVASAMQGDEPATFKPGPVMADEEDDFHARTEKVIAFAHPHPKLRHGRRSHEIQYFRFSDKIMRSKVVRAQLWLYVRGAADQEFETTPTSADEVRAINVSVLRVLRVSGQPLPPESPTLEILHTSKEEQPRGRGGWITVEVKKLLTEWFKYPRDNLGIIVQATDEQGNQLAVTDPDAEDGSLRPFVEVYTTDGRKHRTKRTIGLNCDETSGETRCCRYPLTVDFEEFGWDWIIAPKKYEANYCAGECPYVFLQKYPHTHIVHLANPAGTVGPCCAPRKMSAISMLYFDHEFNIIYGLLPGMVVDRCGCS